MLFMVGLLRPSGRERGRDVPELVAARARAHGHEHETLRLLGGYVVGAVARGGAVQVQMSGAKTSAAQRAGALAAPAAHD
jgi:hypothetical protein